MAAKVVNLLDDRVNRHFVLVVALRRVPRGRERVAFVDDEECLPGLSGLLGDDFKRLVEKRAHLADLARSTNAGAELKEHRLLLRTSRASLSHAPSAVTVFPVPTSPAKITSGYLSETAAQTASSL